jgi:hypothetical protein
MPMVFTHGATSRELLHVDWQYPVHVPKQSNNRGGTVSIERRALTVTEALEEIAANDKRPLLVLRECNRCRGTDLALLDERFADERTLLLTNWFHCVRLPTTIAEPNQPFHALFAADHKSHLFLSQADGSGRIDIDGTQTQAKLWSAMGEVLRASYVGTPVDSTREILKVLAQFDRIDDRENRLLAELDQELDQHGTKSPRVHKLQAEAHALGEEKKQLVAQVGKLRNFDLKAKPVPDLAGAGSSK